MRTLNSLVKLSVAAAAIGAAALIWAGWGAGRAGAADHRDRRGFGLISLNPGQVARLNVFSLDVTENTRADSEEARPRRMLVAFDVYTRQPEAGRAATGAAASGVTALRLAARRSTEVVLARGEAVTWDFTAPPDGAVIRAVVNPDAHDPHLIYSLELMEGGRTTQVINPNEIGE
jgi:hypothetical protein